MRARAGEHRSRRRLQAPRRLRPGAAPQVREGAPRGRLRSRCRAVAVASCSRPAVNGLEAGEGHGPRKPAARRSGGRVSRAPHTRRPLPILPPPPTALQTSAHLLLLVSHFVIPGCWVVAGGGSRLVSVSFWGRARSLPSARSLVWGSPLRVLCAAHSGDGWRPVSGVQRGLHRGSFSVFPSPPLKNEELSVSISGNFRLRGGQCRGVVRLDGPVWAQEVAPAL